MKIQLDMYQTMAVAVAVLMLGSYLRKKIDILERFCIPAPVVGGFLFAIFTCICYATGILEFEFDDILKEVCMVFFFTSVGFQANLKVLKKGGKSLIVFLGLVIVLIFTQNFVAVGLSKLLGLNSLIGMCTGSIPMVGGHGTAGAFGPVLEDFNVQGATTICTAAATFGLIFGSIIGGPLGKRLIEKKDLLKTAIPEDDSLLVEDEKKHERHTQMYAAAVFQLIIAIGIGTVFSWALTQTGMTFPIYIGAMIAAALMRNIAEYAGNDKLVIHMGEINDLGGIALSLFLGMAMITLKLWQLASLALPLVILLVAQVVLIILYTYFVVFNVMGRDYDAAVLVAGTCGFGMGATPNAMANMQALCDKYVPSVKAYLIIPLIGSLFMMKGRKLDTIYIGGGTPTTLLPYQIRKLLDTVGEAFGYEGLAEFTVEAGRPDSITREKLMAIREYPVTRISVNPQTMNQETLDIIGRRHTVEQTKEAFHLARELGYDNINMDLIVGLPGEDIHMVERTLEQVRELAPDSITVHSLAVKRAARLNIFKEKYQEMSFENNQEIMDLTMKTAYEMGMGPYYLYRQKNMKGNFENVGYAKVDKAGIYNILIMEEKQPIIALGAGGSSKLVFDHGQRIERVENVKDVSNYISRIDEMIERKRTAIATWL